MAARSLHYLVLSIAAALFSASASQAQNGTWIQNGAAPPYDWSTASNWQSNVVADGIGNTATFATAGLTGPMIVNLDSNRTIGNLFFDNPTNAFSWNVTGFGTELFLQVGAGTPTITVGTNLTAAIGASLNGTQGFLKDGNGTLSLGRNNIYTGDTRVTAGVLNLDYTQGLTAVDILPTATNLILGSGGSLAMTVPDSVSASQTVTSTVLNAGSANIAISVGTGGAATLNLGAITRNAGSTLSFSQPLTVATITTSSANGANTILGGWSVFTNNANGATGWTVVNGGTIGALGTYTAAGVWGAANDTDQTTNGIISPAAGSTTNSLRFNNGGGTDYTVSLSGLNTIASGGILVTPFVGSGAGANITGGSLTSGNGTDLIITQLNFYKPLTITSQITGSIGLTTSGIGTIVLGNANNYTGNTVVGSGTLLATTTSSLPGYNAPNTVFVQGGGTLSVSTSDLGPWLPSDIDTLRANAVFSPGSSLGFDVSVGNSLTYAANISGNLGVTKNSDGTLVLTGNSNFTGLTNINGGVLSANTISNSGVASAIGAGTDLTFGTGGTFQYTGASASVDRGIQLRFNGGAINVSNGATNLSLSGLVYGVGGLTKSGPGTLTIAGTGTYAGPTLVTAGTLVFSSANSIPANNNLTIFTGATVTIGAGASPTLAGLSGGGTLNLGTATTLTLGSDFGSGSFQGTIAGPAGLAVVKNGNGIQVLIGGNTYGGGTTVNGGTLLLSPQTALANPLGTGTVTLATAGVTLAYRQLLPVPTTGYNRDVIYGVGEGSNNPIRTTADLKATVGFDVPNNLVYVSNGVPGANSTVGLPRNLAINSLVGGGSTFIMQPYNANNVLFLTAGSTATLGIGSPGSFRSINLLTSSTNGASAFTATLNFQDGTSTLVTGLSSLDWFGGTAGLAIGGGGSSPGLDRYNFITNTFDGNTTNPRLYQVGINLSTVDSAKVLTSITLTSQAGGNTAFGVFAINGTTSGAPATLSPGNPVAITAPGQTNLEVSGYTAINFGNLTLNGNTGANTVALTGTTGSTMNFTGTTFVGTAPTLNVATGVTMNLGVLTDANAGIGLTKAGAGTLILASGTAYTGGVGAGSVAITGGTLIAQAPSALPGFTTAGTITLSSGGALVAGFGAGQFSQANITTLLANVTFVNGSQFGLDVSTGTATYSSVLALPSGVGFVKTGSGILALGNANTYTGATTISGGELSVANLGLGGFTSSIGASSAAAANLVFNNGALLQYTGPTATTNRSFTLNPGTGTASGGGFNIPSGTVLTATGASTGAGIFYKTGAGTLVLTGANASTGGVTINGGTLQVGAGGSIGSLSTTGNILNNGTLTFFRSDTVTQSNAISGTGNLVKLGAGTLILSGTNTYTGTTTVSTGILQAGSTAAFGTGSAVSVAAGATLALNGFSNTIGSLSGAGTVTNNGTGNATLTFGDANNTTFSGVIQNGGTGTLALVKTGTGSLTLTGISTYSGGTTLTDGTLNIPADTALGTGAFTGSALGTLNYTATTTSIRSFNMFGGTISVNSGAVLTNSGGSISNAFLTGSGTIASGANGIRYANVTAQPSVSLTSNSSFDRFQNFSNGGQITVGSGVVSGFNGFVNQAAGRIVVGNGATVSAANYQSYGVMNVTGTGNFNNTGSSPITLGGGSITNVGVYNPSNGQVTLGGTINIGSQNLVVQGGFLRNNGAISGAGNIIVEFGGVAKGTGDYDVGNVITRNGGQFLSGNSPGLTRVSASTVTSLTGGDLNNATGLLGAYPSSVNGNLNNSGWGGFEYGNSANTGGGVVIQRTAAGPATWRFRTTVNDGIGDTPGAPANFNPANNYAWAIFRPRTNASLSTPLPLLPTDQINSVATITLLDQNSIELAATNSNLNTVLAFDASQFINPTTGLPIAPTAGTFSFSFGPDLVGRPNTVIYLNYTAAIPEPTMLLGIAAVGGLLALRRRKA